MVEDDGKFLEQLGTMFEDNKETGTVYLTLKRTTRDQKTGKRTTTTAGGGATSASSSSSGAGSTEEEEKEKDNKSSMNARCLIRVDSNKKKGKFSTHVPLNKIKMYQGLLSSTLRSKISLRRPIKTEKEKSILFNVYFINIV